MRRTCKSSLFNIVIVKDYERYCEMTQVIVFSTRPDLVSMKYKTQSQRLTVIIKFL